MSDSNINNGALSEDNTFARLLHILLETGIIAFSTFNGAVALGPAGGVMGTAAGILLTQLTGISSNPASPTSTASNNSGVLSRIASNPIVQWLLSLIGAKVISMAAKDIMHYLRRLATFLNKISTLRPSGSHPGQPTRNNSIEQ